MQHNLPLQHGRRADSSRTQHLLPLPQAANDPEGGLTTVIVRPRFVWGKGAHTLPCLR